MIYIKETQKQKTERRATKAINDSKQTRFFGEKISPTFTNYNFIIWKF